MVRQAHHERVGFSAHPEQRKARIEGWNDWNPSTEYILRGSRGLRAG